jgi:multimeric flavodoxin WrbA
MPKLLVLFHSRSPDVVALAEAATDGARSVRFAEVDLRRLDAFDARMHATEGDTAGRAHRTLQHVEDIATYDGLILVLPEASEAGATLTETIGSLGATLVNKVGSVITAAEGDGHRAALWSALTPMADRGMILVPAPFTNREGSTVDSARRMGRRVAEVIGWVTHARSHHHHEPHQHDHQHDHSHHHD